MHMPWLPRNCSGHLNSYINFSFSLYASHLLSLGFLLASSLLEICIISPLPYTIIYKNRGPCSLLCFFIFGQWLKWQLNPLILQGKWGFHQKEARLKQESLRSFSNQSWMLHQKWGNVWSWKTVVVVVTVGDVWPPLLHPRLPTLQNIYSVLTKFTTQKLLYEICCGFSLLSCSWFCVYRFSFLWSFLLVNARAQLRCMMYQVLCFVSHNSSKCMYILDLLLSGRLYIFGAAMFCSSVSYLRCYFLTVLFVWTFQFTFFIVKLVGITLTMYSRRFSGSLLLESTEGYSKRQRKTT